MDIPKIRSEDSTKNFSTNHVLKGADLDINENESFILAGETSNTADLLPSDVSGDKRERVGFARASVNNPTIILLNEPTADLDL
jgi:ABC-type multidrug transport system ATPase subunit